MIGEEDQGTSSKVAQQTSILLSPHDNLGTSQKSKRVWLEELNPEACPCEDG
jgi:hypothetical protein